MNLKINFESVDELHRVLVPREGTAKTVAGEIIRATSRLVYRFYNDGDIVGLQCGNETCNSSVRYLEEMFEDLDVEIKKSILKLWDAPHLITDEYEDRLAIVVDKIVNFINENPNLKEEANSKDSRGDEFQRHEDYEYSQWDDEDDDEDCW